MYLHIVGINVILDEDIFIFFDSTCIRIYVKCFQLNSMEINWNPKLKKNDIAEYNSDAWSYWNLGSDAFK